MINTTTKVSSLRSIGEIHSILIAAGVSTISNEMRSKEVVGLYFCIEFRGALMNFRLPCNYMGVLAAMKKDPKVPRRLCTETQARAVGWRILREWVRAQLAIVEAEQASLIEVFMPYAVCLDGRTLFQHLEGNPQLMLGQ